MVATQQLDDPVDNKPDTQPVTDTHSRTPTQHRTGTHPARGPRITPHPPATTPRRRTHHPRPRIHPGSPPSAHTAPGPPGSPHTAPSTPEPHQTVGTPTAQPRTPTHHPGHGFIRVAAFEPDPAPDTTATSRNAHPESRKPHRHKTTEHHTTAPSEPVAALAR